MHLAAYLGCLQSICGVYLLWF